MKTIGTIVQLDDGSFEIHGWTLNHDPCAHPRDFKIKIIDNQDMHDPTVRTVRIVEVHEGLAK